MTEDEELKEQLDCAENKCGHHPQFDCDRHHPNPILASAYRAIQSALKQSQLKAQSNSRLFDEVSEELRMFKDAQKRWEFIDGLNVAAWKQRAESAEQAIAIERKAHQEREQGLKAEIVVLKSRTVHLDTFARSIAERDTLKAENASLLKQLEEVRKERDALNHDRYDATEHCLGCGVARFGEHAPDCPNMFIVRQLALAGRERDALQSRLTHFEQMEVRYLDRTRELEEIITEMGEALLRIKGEAYGAKQWSYVVDQCARISLAAPIPSSAEGEVCNCGEHFHRMTCAIFDSEPAPTGQEKR